MICLLQRSCEEFRLRVEIETKLVEFHDENFFASHLRLRQQLGSKHESAAPPDVGDS